MSEQGKGRGIAIEEAGMASLTQAQSASELVGSQTQATCASA
ncbi:hypothetical protein ACFLWA_02310 [Chloroflexota bacterium]